MDMVLGLGVDIVKIIRLESWLKNQSLLYRYFSKSEVEMLLSLSQRAMESLAGFFAAKEAFVKAVRKRVILKDIIIEKDNSGAPRMRLERSALKALLACAANSTLLSISHEKEFAMATVLICNS